MMRLHQLLKLRFFLVPDRLDSQIMEIERAMSASRHGHLLYGIRCGMFRTQRRSLTHLK